MRIIIGYGNSLRGEDAFGVDVISLLQKKKLKDTKLLSQYQLTPELSLELLEASEIIFIDALYGTDNYALACDITNNQNANLSHHIGPKVIIAMLNNIYNRYPKFQIYSMVTNQFDIIKNKKEYNRCLNLIASYLSK